MDDTIHQLKKEELMTLDDAAVVIRKPDGKRPIMESMTSSLKKSELPSNQEVQLSFC
jgi:uncharacterized membrane protein